MGTTRTETAQSALWDEDQRQELPAAGRSREQVSATAQEETPREKGEMMGYFKKLVVHALERHDPEPARQAALISPPRPRATICPRCGWPLDRTHTQEVCDIYAPIYGEIQGEQ